MRIAAVVTDLDETLLDRGGVFGPEARAAVADLRRQGIPVIPVTSKTEVELRDFLTRYDVGGIGSFENGAGVIDPAGREIASTAVGVESLSETLDQLSNLSGVAANPILRMAHDELEAITGISKLQIPAMLARRWGLPFLAPPGSGSELRRAAHEFPTVRLTRGGVFWHLSGAHGKEDALRLLLRRGAISRPLVGLGDAPNDAGFLALCDVAILIPGVHGDVNAELSAAVPAACAAASPSGRGWAEVIRRLVGSGS